MKPAEITRAVQLILDGKGKPVTLQVRRIPGHSAKCEVTDFIPTGRFCFAYVNVGRYTADITLAELRDDLNAAERELMSRTPRSERAQAERPMVAHPIAIT